MENKQSSFKIENAKLLKINNGFIINNTFYASAYDYITYVISLIDRLEPVVINSDECYYYNVNFEIDIVKEKKKP